MGDLWLLFLSFLAGAAIGTLLLLLALQVAMAVLL